MADIHHAGGTDRSSKTRHHTLEVNVHFGESDSGENRPHQHFDMSANEDIRYYEDAVEGGPLLLGYLYAILEQVHKDVL